MIKHGPKPTRERRGCVWAQVAVRHRGTLRQSLEIITEAEVTENDVHWFAPGSYLTTFLLFLSNPDSTCLGMVPHTVSWTFLHQLVVKKMSPPIGPQDTLVKAVLQMTLPFPRHVKLSTKISHLCLRRMLNQIGYTWSEAWNLVIAVCIALGESK